MLRQRRLNVQQQNALVEKSIRNGAIYWRREPLPRVLKVCGEERGVIWDKSVVLDLNIDFSGMPAIFGLLVTQEERFISFEIDTDSDHQLVKSVETWNDVTAAQDLSLHNRGTGTGRGAFALKVLRELNADAAEPPPVG
jgi:hypothetical protein